MSELFEYKCPNCGGSLQFDPSIQTLKCPYCDSEIDMAALNAREQELDQKTADDNWSKKTQEWAASEVSDFVVYTCNSCGGEILCDENTAASSCPYCGNAVVMKGNLSGDLKPEYVIPFKTDKESAKAAYLNHLKGKKFLPKVFLDDNRIDEIKGVYVPFWLFDADVNASVHYDATTVEQWTDSRNNYLKTNHFDVYRQGVVGFSNVPVDASKSMSDILMQSIEPFDFSQAVDFKTAYLAGYFADKYSISAEAALPSADLRVKSSAREAFVSTVQGYSSVSMHRGAFYTSQGRAKYTLYPVWLLSTTYEGKTYTFAMNGQTGKFVGDLPQEKGAFLKNTLKVGLITAAAAFAAMLLPGLF